MSRVRVPSPAPNLLFGARILKPQFHLWFSFGIIPNEMNGANLIMPFVCLEVIEMQNLSTTFDKTKLNWLLVSGSRWLFLLLICGTFGVSGIVHSQNEEKPTWVDWQNYTIGATGIGIPDTTLSYPVQKEYALEKARETAAELLLGTIEDLNLTSNMTVQDTLAADSLLTSRVKELTKNAKEVDIRYMSDLSVEVDIQLPFTGELAELLLPLTGGGNPVAIDTLHCPLCGHPWPLDKPFPKYLFSLPTFGGQEYTGLVVDVQGLGVQPALAPKIVSNEGEQVYGVGFIDRGVAVSQGIVKYSKDLQQAITDSRIGQNPLVVKALMVIGERKTDLTISNATAMILHYTENNLNFLRQGKVIVVLDND